MSINATPKCSFIKTLFPVKKINLESLDCNQDFVGEILSILLGQINII